MCMSLLRSYTEMSSQCACQTLRGGPDVSGRAIVLKALRVCCHNARTPTDMQLSVPPARRPHQHYAAQGGAARACAVGLPLHVRTCPSSCRYMSALRDVLLPPFVNR